MTSVRRMFKVFFYGGIVGVGIAGIFWGTLGIPFGITLSAVLVFLGVQLFRMEFWSAAVTTWQLVKVVLRALAALILFLVLRFLLGQLVLKIYPRDAYDRLGGQNDGLVGMFWGHAAPHEVVVEIVLLGFIAFAVWRWFEGKKGLVILMGFLIGLATLFPAWSDTWPATTDGTATWLKKAGVFGALHHGFVVMGRDWDSGSDETAPKMQTSLYRTAPTPAPVVAVPQQEPFATSCGNDFFPQDTEMPIVTPQPGCWHTVGLPALPQGTGWCWDIDTLADTGGNNLFYYLRAKNQFGFYVQKGPFRAQQKPILVASVEAGYWVFDIQAIGAEPTFRFFKGHDLPNGDCVSDQMNVN